MMKQYIDFFKKNKMAICRYCHFLLNSYREKAFQCFHAWDVKHSRYQDLRTNMFELLDFKILLNKSHYKTNPYEDSLYKIFHMKNFIQHFTINGCCFVIDTKQQKLPYGVFSGNINLFACRYPNVFVNYYNKQVESRKSELSAFNTMFIQDGYVLYVPENIVVEQPIQLTNILKGKENSLINSRVLIILESNAQAKILLCDHTEDDQFTCSFIQVSEIYLAQKSVLEFYEIEKSSTKTMRFTNYFVRQLEHSKCTLHTTTLNNGITSNNYDFSLEGEYAKTEIYGIEIANNQQKIENFTKIWHFAPRCKSKEIFKYVLDKESVGSFVGEIIVNKNALQTEAYQNNQNILSGNMCRMYSKPQLKIDTDDVNCSHGVTIGQLNELALFYMKSRGITESEARYLLKLAFITDLLNEVRIKKLREVLKLLFKKRFKINFIKY